MEPEKEAQARTILEAAGIDNVDYYISEADAYSEPVPMAEIALFLREAWRPVLASDAEGWVTELVDELDSRGERDDLYALRFLPERPELLAALKDVAASGVPEQSLSTVVRAFQVGMLEHLVNLLDGGHCFEDGLVDNWSLASLDENLDPQYRFGDMKHMLWEFDPEKAAEES